MNLRSLAFFVLTAVAVGCASEVEAPVEVESRGQEQLQPKAGKQPIHECVATCERNREFCYGLAWNSAYECLCDNEYCGCLARCGLRGCMWKKCPPTTP